MRLKLMKLSPEVLRAIGTDISIVYTSHAETAQRIAEYYRSYSQKWADLVAFYKDRFPVMLTV